MKYDLINLIEFDFIYLYKSFTIAEYHVWWFNKSMSHPSQQNSTLQKSPSHENQAFAVIFHHPKQGWVLFGFTPKSAGSKQNCPYQIAGDFFGVYQPHVQTQIIWSWFKKNKKRIVWKVPYLKLVHFRGVHHHEIPCPWNPIEFMVKHRQKTRGKPWPRGPDDAHLDIF